MVNMMAANDVANGIGSHDSAQNISGTLRVNVSNPMPNKVWDEITYLSIPNSCNP